MFTSNKVKQYSLVLVMMSQLLRTKSHEPSASALASCICSKTEPYDGWSMLRSVLHSLWYKLFSSSWACYTYNVILVISETCIALFPIKICSKAPHINNTNIQRSIQLGYITFMLTIVVTLFNLIYH